MAAEGASSALHCEGTTFASLNCKSLKDEAQAFGDDLLQICNSTSNFTCSQLFKGVLVHV